MEASRISEDWGSGLLGEWKRSIWGDEEGGVGGGGGGVGQGEGL